MNMFQKKVINHIFVGFLTCICFRSFWDKNYWQKFIHKRKALQCFTIQDQRNSNVSSVFHTQVVKSIKKKKEKKPMWSEISCFLLLWTNRKVTTVFFSKRLPEATGCLLPKRQLSLVLTRRGSRTDCFFGGGKTKKKQTRGGRFSNVTSWKKIYM